MNMFKDLENIGDIKTTKDGFVYKVVGVEEVKRNKLERGEIVTRFVLVKIRHETVDKPWYNLKIDTYGNDEHSKHYQNIIQSGEVFVSTDFETTLNLIQALIRLLPHFKNGEEK